MDQNDENMGETSGTMVTALAWVSRGFAKPILDNYEPDANELAKHHKLHKKIAKEKKTDEMGKITKQVEEDLANMELDSDSEEVDVPIFTSELARLKAKETGQDFDDADELMEEGAEDVNVPYPEAFSDSEEEKEDYTIRKTDSIIVAATAENDHSNLEIYIYEHEHSNLYVHHEIILGSYPLCIEWLSYFQEQKTNLMIVGTFSPEIEVWNLDSENCEPVFVLGSFDESEKRKKLVKNFKKQAALKESIPEDTHTDAVMSLSLN